MTLIGPFTANHCSGFSNSRSFSCALYSADLSWQESNERLRKYQHFNRSIGGFTQYPFFVRFFTSLLLREQVCPFSSAFLYVHIRTNQTDSTGQKFSEKKFLQRGTSLYWNIALIFIHKIFDQNFHQYITVYLLRICTYKNADEKAHTFLRRIKNVKKRTKNRYCVNSP